jgi:hypothetical protein
MPWTAYTTAMREEESAGWDRINYFHNTGNNDLEWPKSEEIEIGSD